MGFDARRRRNRDEKLGSERELTKRPAAHTSDAQATSDALVARILEAAGMRPDSRQLMRAALEQLREYTGCEAAAIRLEEAGDYPYVVEQGFPAKYLTTDNSLLGRGPDRNPLHDGQGRPILECACGDIIRGRNPADHARFTAEGTFWTGSASEATAYDDRDKLLSPLRGRCAAGGYESVACIPLRAHGDVYGILQLSSKRKHLITPEVLSVVEPAVKAFAGRLRERLADEAVRSGEALHEALSSAMVEAFAYCRLYFDETGAPDDWAYVAANDAFLQLFGISDPVAKRDGQVLPGWREAHPDVMEVFERVVKTRRPERLERHFPGLAKWLVMRVSSPTPDHFLAVFEDISERKQAEDGLLRAQFTLDHVEDYPMWLDSAGRIVEVSESTCRHLEYSRDELLGMTVFDIDPRLATNEGHTSPEERAKSWERSRSRGTFTVESRHLTKSGRVFPVEVGVAHVTFGDVEYQCSFCRDITERKQAEEQLQRMRFSLDTMSDYPLWLDESGRIVDVSESTCRHLEYSRDELLSMTIFDIDRVMAREWWVKHWEELSALGHRAGEVQHRTKSGREFPVEVVTNRVSFAGQDYDCAFCRDISDRKRIEERLQRTQFTIDSMTDYLIWGDSESHIVDVSESTCRHLEYTREELLSMTAFDVDPDLTLEGWTDHLHRVRGTGGETVEIRHKTKSGRVFPVEITMDHVTFEGREYDCSFCRDITERKRVEEQLSRAQFFLDHVNDYPMWTDSSARIVDVSETTCRHLEYTREELLSMTVFDIDPAMDWSEWDSQWEERREVGPRVFETQHRTKSGRLIPVEVVVSRVVFGGREYDCGMIRDITERRRVEDKLLRSQFLVDHSNDYPTWVDHEGRICDVTESTCRHLEYTRDELLSMTIFDVDITVPRDRWEIHWQRMQQNAARTVETTHRTKSGREYPVETSIAHVTFAGKEYDCGFSRDITERKLVEEKLERAQFSLDHMSDYPLWVDSEARLVEVSESTCHYLEYTREELLSMTVFDIDPAMTPERWAAHWRKIQESGTRTVEAQHRTKSGRIIPVEIAGTHVSFGGQEYDCDFCRDISERKKLEESLRLNQLTVEQSLDMVLWIGQDGRLVYVNDSACKMAGRPFEEMVGLHIWELDPSVSPDAWEETWRRTKQFGPFQQEGSLRSADGHIHPLEISSSHVEFEGAEYGVAFARDVGERRRAEQVLRDSEERYRQLFELESDAIILTDDISGRILDVNPAAAELYGYSREELLALGSVDLAVEPEPPRTSPDEPDSGTLLRWNRKKDDTVFPAEVRHRYFELEGRDVRVAVVRDVTERLKAEEDLLESRQMLQLVLDTVPLRIIWKDRNLRYLGCNKAMALDLRLPEPSAIAGLSEEDLAIGPQTGFPPSARSDDLEVIRTGVAKLHYQETTAPAQGSPRMIRTSKVPLRDVSGDIIGLLAIHEDVTERAMTLRALRERDEQLRHSQKMEAVGRLAGGIAHDFNNVLTTIIGYSDLILGSPEGSTGSLAEDVKEIKAAAERASALTKQILAFSRRQALRPEVLSLNRIVSDIERMLTRTIGADIQLTTELDPDLWLVDVDEHQFVQIMLNLAVNARDAMPQGGTLTVKTANVELDETFCQTHPDAQPGNYVMVAVTDTGTGMDDATLAHVFEPFYTTKATGEGTGLGLATVYGVVAQSGGYTYVESELGRGARFTIYLPRVTSDAAGGPRRLSRVGLGTLDTILVVDDDDAFRALTVRILEKRGYRAIPAGDGDQAVEILQNPDIAIDLLLTDIVMPGSLQGDQVGQIAGSLRPGLPVVYMSSYSRDTIVNIGPSYVASDYLEKPFTADSLMKKIQTSLGRNQADLSSI
ncbi:MAG: PAS domain S-box protein [Thermoleophilia bacterium]|nr:PAS domain S-box protein [Thermoleophilia bacterium]